MILKKKNIMNLNKCIDESIVNSSWNKKLIHTVIHDDDVVEIDIDEMDKYDNIEFLKLLNTMMIINHHTGSIINYEFIDDELHHRYNDNMNNLIYKFLNEYDIVIDYDYEKNVNKDIQIKNLYLIDVLYMDDFIDKVIEFEKNENNYYECFYDELIDYINIYDNHNEFYDIQDDIDELYQINDNLKSYIKYDEIIYDLSFDYYYEIQYNNRVYYISNSYF